MAWRSHGRTLAAAALLSLFMLLAGPAVADNEDCLGCHAASEEVVDPEYQIDVDGFMASVHAEMEFGCTDCHEGIEDYPHEIETPASCNDCHQGALEEFRGSIHGDVAEFGDQPCGVCHTVHEVRAVADPESPVSLTKQPETCGKCHSDVNIVGPAGLDTGLVVDFEHSVHGLAAAGNPDRRPAVCSDCHGAHNVLPASNPDSRMNPFRCQAVCAACHAQEVKDYRSSVHWKAFEHGRTAAPTCTVCHGIHTIRHVPPADASPAEARLVRTTCVGCHSSEALMSGFGVPEARVSSYEASYHGLVKRRGQTEVADCASCHGVHAILPSSDPASSVAPANLQKTCDQCHPGAGAEFAKTPVHFVQSDATASETDVQVVLWVKRIYWALLFGVLGGMALHNLIIMGWYVRKKWRDERAGRLRRRFDLSQIVQHTMLVVSFAVLVLSGFMLAYPGNWISVVVSNAGFTEEARRLVHRSAAVLMIVGAVMHAFWMFGTAYGRAELKRIAPKMRDVREVLQNMRFHLGSSEQRAAFAKYDYPAKAEYWALVWGTLIMALTGMVLWFPVVATSFMPPWVIKVSQVIHLFEAWLATLAILIFHFFYVFGHPEIYPFNFAMFHGGMREELAEHEHPAWAEEEEPRTLG